MMFGAGSETLDLLVSFEWFFLGREEEKRREKDPDFSS